MLKSTGKSFTSPHCILICRLVNFRLMPGIARIVRLPLSSQNCVAKITEDVRIKKKMAVHRREQGAESSIFIYMNYYFGAVCVRKCFLE